MDVFNLRAAAMRHPVTRSDHNVKIILQPVISFGDAQCRMTVSELVIKTISLIIDPVALINYLSFDISNNTEQDLSITSISTSVYILLSSKLPVDLKAFVCVCHDYNIITL